MALPCCFFFYFFILERERERERERRLCEFVLGNIIVDKQVFVHTRIYLE